MPRQSMKQILMRIDSVIRQNRRTEWFFIILTTILFMSGISCIVMALITRQYAWSSPSTVTTGLLYWPLKEIRKMREKNIAVAVAPMLITTLPPDMAAAEIKNLLQSLYGEKQ